MKRTLIPAAALAALVLIPAGLHAGAQGTRLGEPGAGIEAPAAVVPVTSANDRYTLKYGAFREGPRTDAAMQRWRDNRLGLIVHWGAYAIPGGVWNGRTYHGSASFLRPSARISDEDYRRLALQWDPKDFDARRYVRMIKDAGFKYIKFTTKHHEGFCMWPTKYTDFSVANTPSKRDIVGELVKACDEEGIDIHFYYSVLDWDHPDWRYSVKTPEDKAAFARYLKFAENQLRELAERYPTVKDFWFDGTWDASVKANGKWTLDMELMLKKLIPGVTVNSRLRADDRGSRHFDSNHRLMGDYESGYERKLPNPYRDLQVTQRDWEGYMTLPVNKWGYHRDWSDSYVKTPVEVLERIVHAVSMGGNMAVNLGPKPDGSLRSEETEMLKYVGDWMKVNGSAIYGCGYAGLEKQDWGYCTKAKDGSINMIVFNRPLSGHLKIMLPRTVKETPTATVLGSGETVKMIHEEGTVWLVSAPKNAPEGVPYVIRLKLPAVRLKCSGVGRRPGQK